LQTSVSDNGFNMVGILFACAKVLSERNSSGIIYLNKSGLII